MPAPRHLILGCVHGIELFTGEPECCIQPDAQGDTGGPTEAHAVPFGQATEPVIGVGAQDNDGLL